MNTTFNSTGSYLSEYIPPVWTTSIFFTVVVGYIIIPMYISNIPFTRRNINCTPHYINISIVLSVLILQTLMEVGRFMTPANIQQYGTLLYTIGTIALCCYTMKMNSLSAQVFIIPEVITQKKHWIVEFLEYLSNAAINSVTQFVIFGMIITLSSVSVYEKLGSISWTDSESMVNEGKILVDAFFTFNLVSMTITYACSSMLLRFRFTRWYFVEFSVIFWSFLIIAILAMSTTTEHKTMEMRPQDDVYMIVTVFNFILIMTLVTPVIQSKYERMEAVNSRWDKLQIIFTSSYRVRARQLNTAMGNKYNDEGLRQQYEQFLFVDTDESEAIKLDEFDHDPTENDLKIEANIGLQTAPAHVKSPPDLTAGYIVPQSQQTVNVNKGKQTEKHELLETWLSYGRPFADFLFVFNKTISATNAYYASEKSDSGSTKVGSSQRSKDRLTTKDNFVKKYFDIQTIIARYNDLNDCFPEFEFVIQLYAFTVATMTQQFRRDERAHNTETLVKNICDPRYTGWFPEDLKKLLQENNPDTTHSVDVKLGIVHSYLELFIMIRFDELQKINKSFQSKNK